MRISKVKIRNMFGISTVELGGESVEITGKNGVGKSSVIDAIRFALENKSDRDYIIKAGETEGEILIETNTGVSIHRRQREGKADYKNVKENGMPVAQPESFLRELFVPIQLNPVEFIMMNKAEQNKAILNLIKFDWDLNWIKSKFGEIPTGVNYEQNILSVLEEIQSEKGAYFMRRQEINRGIREKRAIAADIQKTIPEGYNADKWEGLKLSELFSSIEKAKAHNAAIERAKLTVENAENKNRKIDADYQIAIATIDREADSTRTRLEAEIARLKADIEMREATLANIGEAVALKKQAAEASKSEAMAKACADIDEARIIAAQTMVDVGPQEEEAQFSERMKMLVTSARKVEQLAREVEDEQAKANAFTDKIELARNLPQEILLTACIPVKGLTVKNGVPLINDLPVNNLSEGEKLDLCVEIAAANNTSMQIILIDGAERLAVEMRTELYKRCKERGLQFIAARTTDDDALSITEL